GRSTPQRRSRRELLDEMRQHGLDRAHDRLLRLRGLDAFDAPRVTLGEIEITASHPLEELDRLALEMIGLARGDARASDLDRRIDQQREIGLEPALHAV